MSDRRSWRWPGAISSRPAAGWAGIAICEATGDRTYVAKCCAVGISVEVAACNTGKADAFLARVDTLEMSGPLLAEPAAFATLARAEHADMDGQPHPGHWEKAVAAWEHCDDVYGAAAARHRQADAILRAHGDRAFAAALARRA